MVEPVMTKEQALAFRRRWALVNAREKEELRATPVEVKFRQLCALMDSVKAMGWHEQLAVGEAEVRALWQRVRKAAGVGG